ncbi:MAG: response regulator, partial [Chloroflexota bacterium]
HTVETVADALAYLETQEVPDVIVTDIDLPDGKGIDVITHCREHVKFDDATIIVVSAHAFIRENRVSRFQPDCVLIKPVSPQHLNIIINEELKRRRDPASA